MIFADPKKYAGQVIPVAREAISWTQVAEILTEVTGTKVRRARVAAGRQDPLGWSSDAAMRMGMSSVLQRPATCSPST